jgi:NADH:ubiquinone oxidoreductase subunit E
VIRVSELIAGLRPDNAEMLEALHRIQHEFGYVPKEAIPVIAGHFQTSPAIVFGMIDFYSEIRTEEPAEKVLEWCSGPACLLKGSVGIRRAIEATFKCEMGRATPDGKLGLRLVQCDGTCHLAPLLRFEGRYIGPITTSDAIRLARSIAGVPDAPASDAASGPWEESG